MPLHLLILEDDASHVDAILRSFKDVVPPVEIRVARCLSEYCELVAERAPDVALLDLNLPDGNNMESLTLLSEDNPFPVLVMTSCGNEAVAVAAMKIGALDYLVKSAEVFANMPWAVDRVLREWNLIKAHKQAEEALLIKNFVFDASIAAKSIADPEGHLTEVNDSFLRLWGFSKKKDVIGWPLQRIFSDPGTADAIISSLKENGRWMGDFTAKRCGGGSTFIAHGIATVLRDMSGKLVGFQSSVMDVTERKRAEDAQEELRRRDARLLAVTEAAHDAIFRQNVQGRISYWNPAAQLLFGYSKEEALGKTLCDLLLPECFHAAYREADHALCQISDGRAGSQPIEISTHHKDGHALTITVSLQTVTLDNEWNTVGIVRDVTALKRLETEILSISDREQQRIGQDLHDGLGQQLTALEMKCFLLLDDLSADNFADNRESLRQQLLQIGQSMRDCIKTTRTICYSLSPSHLEEGGLVNALDLLASRTHMPGKIECQFVCTSPVALDVQTASHLYRIAQEAVNNAVKHAQTSRIDIRLEHDHGALRLQIKDYGQGLPERRGRNSGMGIQGMRHRAAVIGALLEIDSRQGIGVECSVSLKKNAFRESIPSRQSDPSGKDRPTAGQATGAPGGRPSADA